MMCRLVRLNLFDNKTDQPWSWYKSVQKFSVVLYQPYNYTSYVSLVLARTELCVNLLILFGTAGVFPYFEHIL